MSTNTKAHLDLFLQILQLSLWSLQQFVLLDADPLVQFGSLSDLSFKIQASGVTSFERTGELRYLIVQALEGNGDREWAITPRAATNVSATVPPNVPDFMVGKTLQLQ